ncbi:MAG: bifunctional diaminohydroxyphosphoribosylaminopyrimidine deaminase/5-amino-6-(5-phosphoribosylamino)uracil reductase RibD [Candidatus Omnitrophica bacterium]|nr:bifunctional diaminohydroxyphosphoribosylaminopyrimidine deaminase/5-amino-6-(5-phosphoribosylamino)uracil reductase RibD [Candidatus Omnitrophota bacterium]MDD5488661.1 bifunctional diaminohydroxyphosphoribosylaminopyrimidine deaminase/5-amino-6-(5-phosphoribosylamino)uracil reductase RibD [Candidatus Omnitrophota bacterium]
MACTDKEHEKFMSMALELAAKADERTYPNPMVGAVITRNGGVVGRGYHRKAGMPHAEIVALKDAAGKARGADMYVTLEPCDHFGKTPPCTEAIIRNGIRSVFVAMKDPNPLVAGKGINKLRKAGIQVKVGLCAGRARELNRKYMEFISSKRPYITLKLAQSLDGKIAARNGTSRWITSPVSRAYVKKLRARHDAVMVGINTVLKDDPLLLPAGKKSVYPVRIVADSKLRTPLRSQLIRTAGHAPVIILFTELAPRANMERLTAVKGVKLVRLRSVRGRVPLRMAMKELYLHGVYNVLVEGGADLAGSLVDEKLVNEVMFFISPKILGGDMTSLRGKGAGDIKHAIGLKDAVCAKVGQDILVRGKICSRV